MNIGRSFKKAEADTGKTASDVSRETGFSIAKIYRLRSSKDAGHINSIAPIAAAFGMKASEFIALGEK
jgi:DNA-binding phage protein